MVYVFVKCSVFVEQADRRALLISLGGLGLGVAAASKLVSGNSTSSSARRRKAAKDDPWRVRGSRFLAWHSFADWPHEYPLLVMRRSCIPMSSGSSYPGCPKHAALGAQHNHHLHAGAHNGSHAVRCGGGRGGDCCAHEHRQLVLPKRGPSRPQGIYVGRGLWGTLQAPNRQAGMIPAAGIQHSEESEQKQPLDWKCALDVGQSMKRFLAFQISSTDHNRVTCAGEELQHGHVAQNLLSS